MVKSSKKKGHSNKTKKTKSVTRKGRTTTKRITLNKGKNKITKVKYESTKEIKIEQALMDNFIALQKIMVNLSSKFDNLSSQISKLLELFEISAKSLATKDFETDKDNKEIKRLTDKLDNISQQAGLIGKGLSLIHEVHREKGNPNPFVPGSEPQKLNSPQVNSISKPIQMATRPQNQLNQQGYQKSISSNISKDKV